MINHLQNENIHDLIGVSFSLETLEPTGSQSSTKRMSKNEYIMMTKKTLIDKEKKFAQEIDNLKTEFRTNIF